MHGALMAAAGSAFGVVAAVSTALITTWVVPELAAGARWAAAGVVPFGLVAGLVVAGFLRQRGTHVLTFRRIVLETVAMTTAVAIAVTQLVIPVAWGLPSGSITAVVALCAAGFGAGGSWLLKPLYWPKA